jgi:RNA polymerase sigma factor (sigma-70 family)
LIANVTEGVAIDLSPACRAMALEVAPPGAAVWSDTELRTHEAALRAAARYICRDEGEREDLIQDAFERGLRFLSAGNPRPTNMRVWLVSILRNAFIDRRRRAAVVFEELDADRAAPAAEPEPPPWADVSIDEVRAALAELDPGLRAAFELHYLERFRYREIAERLGIPANTVATRLFRARKALRDVLLRGRSAT